MEGIRYMAFRTPPGVIELAVWAHCLGPNIFPGMRRVWHYCAIGDRINAPPVPLIYGVCSDYCEIIRIRKTNSPAAPRITGGHRPTAPRINRRHRPAALLPMGPDQSGEGDGDRGGEGFLTKLRRFSGCMGVIGSYNAKRIDTRGGGSTPFYTFSKITLQILTEHA